ncbi:MAG: D-alanyl-D-alanine carboxypeptidase [uncultured Adhaeribacter sp.]|uniref:D-alanyl-D-alanine carboxypeptidase n=1 Tax=uncultured Adhaeribacter sp. TaxID=448109 RepID=A0A6J4HC60_9BACT|nr:MAG: D-alanyl-D-alanine carboxypeptidase [uncultured Adhaeribacter sp.]
MAIVTRLSWFSYLILFSSRWYLFGCLLTLPFAACRTTEPVAASLPPGPAKLTLEDIKQQVTQSVVFKQNFTGFALYDLAENKLLIEHNADKYFIPASNTKIFTFYAGLKILGDSLPALRYTSQHDSLVFWGTGDPTFLHPDQKNDRVWQFLRTRKEKLFFSAANFATEPWGPGWSWDDYNYYYAAERSPLPVYGNVVRFAGKPNVPTVRVQPRYFAQQWMSSKESNLAGDIVVREAAQNRFKVFPGYIKEDFAEDVPFKQSPELLVKLLTDTLHRPVKLLPRRLPKTARTLYSLPADSLYQRMMQESDNTFAEHLLLLCAATVFDSLNTELIIDHVKKTYLADLPDPPVWVDGSGLSRFNLFTPRTLVALWQKIYQEVPRDRLFALLAAGGKTGTLKNMYKTEKPFVFGKSGYLSNNLNQSGYLVTQSGRTYIFAFMNNNFTQPTASMRQEMARIITQIHLNF